MAENGACAGTFDHAMGAAYDINEFRGACESDFGGGIYTFVKFLGSSSVLLTQHKVIFVVTVYL
jgi:hypothetical protein